MSKRLSHTRHNNDKNLIGTSTKKGRLLKQKRLEKKLRQTTQQKDWSLKKTTIEIKQPTHSKLIIFRRIGSLKQEILPYMLEKENDRNRYTATFF